MKTSLIALGLLAALPFAASATDGLSYNHVEGGYVNTDAKGGDADGWALSVVSPNEKRRVAAIACRWATMPSCTAPPSRTM